MAELSDAAMVFLISEMRAHISFILLISSSEKVPVEEKTAVEAGENEKAFITADITYTAENSGSIDFTFSDNGNAMKLLARILLELSTTVFITRRSFASKLTLLK